MYHKYIILFLIVLILSACNKNFDKISANRLDYAKKNKGDVVFVAIENKNTENYIKGIQLAVDEINQESNKLLNNRMLKLKIEQSKENFEQMQSTIRSIANNPQVVAVLGHNTAKVALPASVIYEKSKIIYLSPFSTMEGLTKHRFQYSFRISPSHKIMAKQLASVAELLGYKKIVLLYEQGGNQPELAFLFENALLNKNTIYNQKYKFLYRSSFYVSNNENENNYRTLISQFNQLDFDAIFLSAHTKPAINFVQQLREMGVNVPILGANKLRSEEYQNTVGKAGINTIVPIIYSQNENTQINKKFVKNYKQLYGSIPDMAAAQGYDSVHLLAHIIRKVNSTVPSLLSSALHFLPYWRGVTGIYSFDQDGDVIGKKYHFQVLKKTKDDIYNWVSLPEIYWPYLMKEFQKNLLLLSKKYVLNFKEKLSHRISYSEYRSIKIDLIHSVLNFKKLGIIYENTELGRVISDYDIIKSLGHKKGFDVKECEINFSVLNKTETKNKLVDCFGKLAINIDAMYIMNYPNTNEELMNLLKNSLNFYRLPLFSLSDKNSNNLTLSFKKLDIDFHDPTLLNRYKSLLKNKKMYDFQDQLQYFFQIEANLDILLDYGIDIENIIHLSPIPIDSESK